MAKISSLVVLREDLARVPQEDSVLSVHFRNKFHVQRAHLLVRFFEHFHRRLDLKTKNSVPNLAKMEDPESETKEPTDDRNAVQSARNFVVTFCSKFQKSDSEGFIRVVRCEFKMR